MPAAAVAADRPLAWITGAGGLIGNYLVSATPEGRWQPRALTRADLNLTDFAAVQKLFRTERPTLLMHCAALSKTPACQADPALARKLNVEVTQFLAELAEEIPFVFLSTDLVFDGRKGHYVEGDALNPLSIYAETKAAAEQVVARNTRHSIVRTSLNGGLSPTRDRGFNEEMRLAWKAGRTLDLFTDEFRCPIHARESARALWELAGRAAPGVYHLAGAERVSRWEIGRILAERCPELKPQMRATTLQDYKGAPRSPDTSLDCSKLQKVLGRPLPSLRQWLGAHPTEFF